MSDLISRKELLKALSESEANYRAEHHDCIMNNDPFSDGILSAFFTVTKIVKSLPTAYDIGKVVSELKTDSSVKLYGSQNSDNYMIPVKRAIEIVKQGGVGKDVSK